MDDHQDGVHPRRVFATRAEANLVLFEYIDGFYNSRRIQKRLGYLSPIEFEEKHYAGPGNGRTNEPETPSTRPDQLISTSRTLGEPQHHLAHDTFGVPFDEISRILDRSQATTRKLARRADRVWAAVES
ncbi:IS3 family transposase [Streptomyces sp. DG2A-72]|uniref:IS3 family transposase n=1 Tax=Streptomyces sp. DG2A-72 TaxID=3051386 RepID=UPI00265BF7B8|nr:IS3 family transposase [Streptomyces sp. DG2A-72]MDO0936759.1 IS3 family transposase [Streptomyces sp. DG2A-72]